MKAPSQKVYLILLGVTLPLALVIGFNYGYFFMVSAAKTNPLIGYLNIFLLISFYFFMAGIFGFYFYVSSQYLFNSKKVFKAFLKRKTVGIGGKRFSEIYKKTQQIRYMGSLNFFYILWALSYFYHGTHKFLSDFFQIHPGYFPLSLFLVFLCMAVGFLWGKSWLWKDSTKEKKFKQTPFTLLLMTKI